MPRKTDAAVVRTIGIDTGKNTLHMIGLDEKGAIVLREKVSRTRVAASTGISPGLVPRIRFYDLSLFALYGYTQASRRDETQKESQ